MVVRRGKGRGCGEWGVRRRKGKGAHHREKKEMEHKRGGGGRAEALTVVAVNRRCRLPCERAVHRCVGRAALKAEQGGRWTRRDGDGDGVCTSWMQTVAASRSSRQQAKLRWCLTPTCGATAFPSHATHSRWHSAAWQRSWSKPARAAEHYRTVAPAPPPTPRNHSPAPPHWAPPMGPLNEALTRARVRRRRPSRLGVRGHEKDAQKMMQTNRL